ncbi:MAG: cupin domain-containing protein, partial [Chthoniobacterales bacterium]
QQATAMRGGVGDAYLRILSRGEGRSPLRATAINRLPPGSSWGPEKHPHAEEILIILSGEAEVIDSGGRHTLTTHDSLQAQPNERLAIRNAGASELIFLAILINHPRSLF